MSIGRLVFNRNVDCPASLAALPPLRQFRKDAAALSIGQPPQTKENAPQLLRRRDAGHQGQELVALVDRKLWQVLQAPVGVPQGSTFDDGRQEERALRRSDVAKMVERTIRPIRVAARDDD